MKKLLCSLFVLALIAGLMPSVQARADGNLDEIENYNIKIDMEKDGTMDIVYHIDWKVLDGTSEGPLTWVKIGIPNQYADNLKALSGDIKGISYMNDGGDYVRLDLDRSYTTGEVVPMDFSIHQAHMYALDSGGCSYRFTPGWFDGAEVKSLTILWNSKNVQSSDSTTSDGDYLIWSTSLAAGERFGVSVSYAAGVFNTTSEGALVAGNTGDSQSVVDNSGGTSYVVDNSSNNSMGVGTVFAILLFIAVFVLSIVRRVSGGGGYRGGFGTRYIGGGGFGGGGHCACASSCACACACACAGGGRAGCSAKNFYGSAIQISKLRRALR